MICYDNKVIRQLGWRRILKACFNDPYDIQGIRTFKIPNLNLKAENYYNIIDWQNVDVSEPPVTKNIEINQNQQQYSNGQYILQLVYPHSLPHTSCEMPYKVSYGSIT